MRFIGLALLAATGLAAAQQTASPPPQTASPPPPPTVPPQVVIHGQNAFCLFLPPQPGLEIAPYEDNGIPFCTDPSLSPNSKKFPDGFITVAHYLNSGSYEQVTGYIDRTKYMLQDTDGGGQYDNHGNGKPTGAMCNGYPYFVSMIEPAENRFCIRCCVNKADCPTGRSQYGCLRVVPGDYNMTQTDPSPAEPPSSSAPVPVSQPPSQSSSPAQQPSSSPAAASPSSQPSAQASSAPQAQPSSQAAQPAQPSAPAQPAQSSAPAQPAQPSAQAAVPSQAQAQPSAQAAPAQSSAPAQQQPAAPAPTQQAAAFVEEPVSVAPKQGQTSSSAASTTTQEPARLIDGLRTVTQALATQLANQAPLDEIKAQWTNTLSKFATQFKDSANDLGQLQKITSDFTTYQEWQQLLAVLKEQTQNK